MYALHQIEMFVRSSVCLMKTHNNHLFLSGQSQVSLRSITGLSVLTKSDRRSLKYLVLFQKNREKSFWHVSGIWNLSPFGPRIRIQDKSLFAVFRWMLVECKVSKPGKSLSYVSCCEESLKVWWKTEPSD